MTDLPVGKLRPVRNRANPGGVLPLIASLVSVPPLMPSDALLVDRARQGDLDAFSALVERHRDIVLRVATRVVGPADAEDVAQDAFLRAFHRLGRFRGDAAFRSWLLQITHNAALDALGRGRRTVPESDVGADIPDSESARIPAQRLEQRERSQRLRAKITTLTPAHRAVLVLRDIEGLAYDEIAEVTETPVGSVKGRLHRARGELIDLLRHNTYDWELPE
jgi:RNA polymerase sigma-70 factor (ECF subfamily)